MKCPDFDDLVSFSENQLDGPATDRVRVHLSECSNCVGAIQWYEGIRSLTAEDDSVSPPGWVMKRALRVFEDRTHRGELVEGLVGAVGRGLARLVFDSGLQPATPGVRSASAEARQLLYRAGEFSVDLQVAAIDQARSGLTGQILREGELEFESVGGLALTLAQEGGTVHSTVTNNRGEFSIASVESGSYDLGIKGSELDITIVGLSIAGG
jgi:hypothetical protein